MRAWVAASASNLLTSVFEQWAAAGFKDTLLKLSLEQEVVMGTRRRFSREFKIETVKLVMERGLGVARVSRDLDIGETVLRRWVKELSVDAEHAFPDGGSMKPEQAEIARLKKEVAKLKMERDILKKPQPTSRRNLDVKFEFIAKYRRAWPVNLLFDALGVSRSGFYAWLTTPHSARMFLITSRCSTIPNAGIQCWDISAR